MNPLERVSNFLDQYFDYDAQSWEIIVTRIWVLEITIALNIAAVILMVRLFVNWARQRSRKSRMIRASAFVMLSFAMIMDRYFITTYALHGNGIPRPYALVLWTFWGLCATYFLFAITVEWIVPALFGMATWLSSHEWGDRGKDTPELRDETVLAVAPPAEITQEAIQDAVDTAVSGLTVTGTVPVSGTVDVQGEVTGRTKGAKS